MILFILYLSFNRTKLCQAQHAIKSRTCVLRALPTTRAYLQYLKSSKKALHYCHIENKTLSMVPSFEALCLYTSKGVLLRCYFYALIVFLDTVSSLRLRKK